MSNMYSMKVRTRQRVRYRVLYGGLQPKFDLLFGSSLICEQRLMQPLIQTKRDSFSVLLVLIIRIRRSSSYKLSPPRSQLIVFDLSYKSLKTTSSMTPDLVSSGRSISTAPSQLVYPSTIRQCSPNFNRSSSFLRPLNISCLSFTC
jgi:hypothetical protein